MNSATYGYDVDTAWCNSMVSPFRNAFCGGDAKVLGFHRGRFKPRAYVARNSDGFFNRRSKSKTGVPTISAIIDMSGSMMGEPGEAATQFCAVLSRLHALGLVNVNMFLSGSSGDEHKNGFRVPLPQPDWVFARMSFMHGTECLSQTFKMYMDDIANSAIVTCYTDADICDSELRPQLWRKHGTSCVGLYRGALKQIKVMDRYFDYSIVRTNRNDLFTSYLALVKGIVQANHK